MELNEKEVLERIVSLERTQEAIRERMEHIEGLVESVNKIGMEMKYMREDLNKLVEKVEAVESKPAKRWETLITGILSGIVGIIIGFATKFLGG